MGFIGLEAIIIFLQFVFVRSELVVRDMEFGADKYPLSPGIDSRGFANTSSSVCGYTLTCRSGTVFFNPREKLQENFRCSFLILPENITAYEINIVNFGPKGVGIIIGQLIFNDDSVGQTIINQTGILTIKAHALMVNIYTGGDFKSTDRFGEPIIIDYKGIKLANETPISDYSSARMIMPDSTYRHPLKLNTSTDLPKNRELSLVGLLPKNNYVSVTLPTQEPKLMSFVYRRRFPSNDPNCMLQRVLLYTFEIIEDKPKLSFQLRICSQANVVSYDIVDVGLVVIKSTREGNDRVRGFDLEYFHAE